MSSFTRCTARTSCAAPLGVRLVARAALLFAVALGFAAARLHLQFSIDRAKAELARLQTERATLASDINALRGENERLKDPERLYELARLDWGMVAHNPAEVETLRISAPVAERMAAARLAAAGVAAGEHDLAASPRLVWLRTLSERMGLIGNALARERTPDERGRGAGQ